MTDLATPVVSAEQARALTDRIKVAVDGTWLLIQEAYTGRAWAALGYRTWDDYCTREFGTSRLRLPREERQEVVASLREIGMSVRAIAAATGQGRETIRKEIAGDQKWSPATQPQDERPAPAPEPEEEVAQVQYGDSGPTSRAITGTDGKRYPAQSPKPVQRPALPPQFQSVAAELTRVIARVERLQADDRYRTNRAAIANQCLPEIRRAASVLHGLLSDLGHEIGGPQ